MQKKIITAIILICLVGIISFSYFFLKKKSQTIENSVFEVIPSNTAALIEVKNVADLLSLTHSSFSIWEDISVIPIIQDCNSILSTIDSTIKRNPSFSSFSQNSITVTLHQIGKNKLEFVFFVPLKSDEQITNAAKIIQAAYSKYSISNYNFDGKAVITSLQNEKTKTNKLSYTICNNILIAGNSRISIENAVKSYYDKTNLLSLESFKKVKKTAGNKVVANLYVNLHQLSNLALIFASDSHQDMLSKESLLASWAEFDITIKENSILLNGFTTFENEKEYFSIFNKQTPVKLEITSVIPAGITSFISLGISDKILFQKNYENYLTKTGRIQEYKKTISSLNALFSSPNQDPINIVQSFYSFFDTEAAIVFGNANESNVYENTFAVIKTTSQIQAKEKILAMLDSYCEKTNKSIDSYTNSYNSYKIYELPTSDIPKTIFGSVFSKVSATYFTFIENYIVFGESNSSLQNYINAYELQKTLANEQGFKKIQDNLLSTYSFYFHSDISKSTNLYKDFVNSDSKIGIEKYEDVLKKFDAFTIQLSSDNSMLYNNIFLNFNTVHVDKPHTVWECFMDTTIICRPKVITTHQNETYVVVQDGFNKLYLINNSGKTEWKKQLHEAIISDIYEVDYFKNGKIQYACNSRNYIYIIDRLGNFVNKFPLKLQSPATTGMAIFDYDKNKEYRIFIPCANKKVYLYSGKGELIKDWKFKATETEVTSPVQHFVTGGKDYIVFADNFSTYIVNRKGEPRIKVKEQIEKSPKNTFTFEPSAGKFPARIVTTDVNGNIKYIDFQGNVTTLQIKKVSKNHFFEYRDFDNDGNGDFMFLDNNELEIYSQKNSKLSSYYFDAPISQRPIIYNFSKNIYKIGVVDITNSKIYLINSNGSLHKGFPLKGKSLFTIGFLNKNSSTFNLIINGEENYLYNYEIK